MEENRLDYIKNKGYSIITAKPIANWPTEYHTCLNGDSLNMVFGSFESAVDYCYWKEKNKTT